MVDCITQEAIESGKEICVIEGEHEYMFSVDTLIKMYHNDGKWYNPFTTNLLSSNVLDNINKYADSRLRTIRVVSGTVLGKTWISGSNIRAKEVLRLRVKYLDSWADICKRIIGYMGYQFFCRNIQLWTEDGMVSFFDILYDIPPSEDIILYMPNILSNSTNKWNYDQLHKLIRCKPSWFSNIIPEKYHSSPNINFYLYFAISYGKLKHILLSWINKEITNKQLISSFVQSDNYITYNEYCTLVDILKEHDITVNDKTYMTLFHLLCKCVVDKWNFKYRNIEGYYFRSKYDLCDDDYYDLNERCNGKFFNIRIKRH